MFVELNIFCMVLTGDFLILLDIILSTVIRKFSYSCMV